MENSIWQTVQSAQGTYYWNRITNETTWENPYAQLHQQPQQQQQQQPHQQEQQRASDRNGGSGIRLDFDTWSERLSVNGAPTPKSIQGDLFADVPLRLDTNGPTSTRGDPYDNLDSGIGRNSNYNNGNNNYNSNKSNQPAVPHIFGPPTPTAAATIAAVTSASSPKKVISLVTPLVTPRVSSNNNNNNSPNDLVSNSNINVNPTLKPSPLSSSKARQFVSLRTSPVAQPPNKQTMTSQLSPDPPPPLINGTNPEAVNGVICLTVHRAKDLPNIDHNDRDLSKESVLPQAFVRIIIEGRRGPRTETASASLNPIWEQSFEFPVQGRMPSIVFEVKDEDLIGVDHIAFLAIPSYDLLRGFGERFFLLDTSKMARAISLDPASAGAPLLCLSASYVPADTLAPVTSLTMPFEERNHCGVTFYQSCDYDPAVFPLPIIAGLDGEREPTRLYHDMYEAILNARHFIYLSAWSLWPELRLDRKDNLSPPLAHLLQQKAEEGVIVNLLIWEEVMCHDNPYFSRSFCAAIDKVKGTFSDEVRRFFRDTGVNCQIVGRKGPALQPGPNATTGALGSDVNMLARLLGNAAPHSLFSHHQSTLVVDAPSSHISGRRRVVAFVGSAELTEGRYDTPQHSLFLTLHTVHSGDISVRFDDFDYSMGPRTPWHDTHAKVEGPIARDIMHNFEQRWLKQADLKRRGFLQRLHQDVFLSPEEDIVRGDAAWNMQMLRSIDSHSAEFTRFGGRAGKGGGAGGAKGYFRNVDTLQWLHVSSLAIGSRLELRPHIPDHKFTFTMDSVGRINLPAASLYVVVDKAAIPGAPLVLSQLGTRDILNATFSLSAEGVLTHNDSGLIVVAQPESRYGVILAKAPLDGNSPKWEFLEQSEVKALEDGVEHSIMDAYIHHIRRAENFIYIENDCFIGSSSEWEGAEGRGVDCTNRIPAEIADKIVAKIRKNERFAVYVLVPLYPDGVPESGEVQSILFWQFKTFEFIYKRIAMALTSMQNPAAPTDYFQVFFLGNRESPLTNDSVFVKNERQKLLCSSRRMPIHVGSKLMIVDDETLIIGSASINDRSMLGHRDTEIAVVGYQPRFTRDAGTAKGGVYAFRMSIWAEHLGFLEQCFEDAHSIECVRRVRIVAEHNWRLYSAPPPASPIYSHLCLYPFIVAQNGAVSAVLDCFPDSEKQRAKILGARQPSLPPILTI